MSVPLPGGGKAAISHKSVNHAKKTLGAMTSPDGNSAACIRMMLEKAQKWINSVRKWPSTPTKCLVLVENAILA
jgi:hypothetical protein